MLFNSQASSEVTIVNEKEIDNEYLDDLDKRTFDLAHIIENGLKDTTARLKSIEYDINHFPKRLIHVDSNSSKDGNNIELLVQNIIQSVEDKSVIKENEPLEIIVSNKEGKKIN